MKMRSPSLFFAASLLSLTLLPLQASAQSASVSYPVSAAETESRWGIGAGASLKRKAYEGVGTDTTAIPLLTYENRWVRFAGPTIDLKLPAGSGLAFALRTRYAFEDGYEPGDAPLLNGMAERRSSWWLGGAALWRQPFANLSMEWLADASGHSDGQRLRLAAEKPMRVGNFLHTPRLAVNWLDKNYVDYYYGVTATEARPGRPAYEGQSTVSAELGLRSVYALTREQSVYLDVSASRLGNEIRNSPLVNRSGESALRFGYVYQFR